MTSTQRVDQIVAGRYRLVDRIGDGGMARVFRARDLRNGGFVAVKLLRGQYADDPAAVARFRHEAQAACALEHPHVVRVLDLGDDAGQPFLVMELVGGGDLRARLRRDGALALPSALQIAVQICGALQAAHAIGIVHRDVKPSNILLEARPDATVHARLADFGIARAAGAARQTRTGEVMGSVHYVSPEQLRGQPATAQSDLYGLGCVLFELLTGRPPFDAETAIAVAMRQLQDLPPRPSALRGGVPAAVDEIVLTCLRKRPEQRFEGAMALAAALRSASRTNERHTQPIRAPVAVVAPQRPGPGSAVQRPARGGPSRRGFLRPAAGAFALTIVAATGAGGWRVISGAGSAPGSDRPAAAGPTQPTPATPLPEIAPPAPTQQAPAVILPAVPTAAPTAAPAPPVSLPIVQTPPPAPPDDAAPVDEQRALPPQRQDARKPDAPAPKSKNDARSAPPKPKENRSQDDDDDDRPGNGNGRRD